MSRGTVPHTQYDGGPSSWPSTWDPSPRDREPGYWEEKHQDSHNSAREQHAAWQLHQHHDYTNISQARRDRDRHGNNPATGGDANGDDFRETHHFPTNNGLSRNDEGPARVEATNVHSRERRDGGGRGERSLTSPGSASFRSQRAELARQRRLFEDREYPPVDTSLYYSRRPSGSVKWMRPGGICAPDRPVFAHGGFSRFDVKQGMLGDCWFVAAIACLCGPDYHQLLNRVIPDLDQQTFQEGVYAGMFCFRFWHFGEWQEVLIDDYLPTQRGALMFIHSSQRNEFWPALMEKAYAKLYGSYEALKAGHMAESLTDLTGGLAETYILRGERANYPQNLISILFKALDRAALIGCSISDSDGVEGYLPNGLVTGHAYSITALRQVPVHSANRTLIRVRNPHGSRNEWKGRWGDSSPDWNQVHPSTKEQLGLIRRSDGEFWMDFDDFMDNFDTITVCNLTADAPVSAARKWHTAQHHGRWVKHFNAGGYLSDSHWANPQYVLRLEDTDDDDDGVCSVIIQLMQKDRRRLKHKGEEFLHIGFIVYRVPQGYSVPLNKEFFERNGEYASCDSFINTRQVVKRLALPPGMYVVLPCTYYKDKEADFYIRFFFEKGQVSEYADEPPERTPVVPHTPTPSPKHQEQEKEFQEFFYKMSGQDMEIDCFELHKAVNQALSKERLHREISLDACRSFVSLMDVDNSGRLGFTEFLYLWSVLRTWKKTFLQHDADNSGKMDARELRTALASNGYKVSNQMMASAIFRYADPRGTISLDNFLILMARLMHSFNVYQKHVKNDKAVFSLEQWVDAALRL